MSVSVMMHVTAFPSKLPPFGPYTNTHKHMSTSGVSDAIILSYKTQGNNVNCICCLASGSISCYKTLSSAIISYKNEMWYASKHF